MTEIQWQSIKTQNDFEILIQASYDSDQIIFKHSPSCGISNLVKSRIEKESKEFPEPPIVHLIDVINHRNISSHVTGILKVRHESPQILIVAQGNCTFHTSHFDISLKNIPEQKEV